jgi:DNA polymerase-2
MAEYSGFLLTRHWRDTPQGVELTFWMHTPEGPLRLTFPAQKAVCFIPRDSQLPANGHFERRALKLETLHGEPVDGLYFQQQREMQRLASQLSHSDLLLLESDIKPSDRFLMERFITASLTAEGKASQCNGHLQMTHPRIRTGEALPHFRYLSLDIETDGIQGEILSIACCGQGIEEILMQGEAGDWENDLPIRWHASEKALLTGFLERIRSLDPDLILGWNLINFDLNYLEQRCRYHGIPFSLGRGDESATILQPQQNGQARVASIPGRVALDGIDNLKSAFWSFDSFSLGHVAGELLGRGKLIESSSDEKIAEIRRLFREDRPALAAYNLEDCRLVEDIFEKTDLINFATQRALMTGLPLGRQGGSVAAFDNLYLPRMHRAGAVAYDIGAFRHDLTSPGGYVMDSQPGFYDNVLVLDFKSLYPSIIRTFLIDPYGMAFPGDEPVPGFHGARFARHGSILPEIIGHLWEQRDRAKRENNPSLSQAVKIIMNSFYGVLGSSGCRFYDPRLASSITRRGHEIIRRSREWIENQGYPVIYGDTDSVFVLVGPGHDERQSREIGERLAAGLNRWWKETIEREFQLPSALEIEFETHFIRFLMPTIRGSETGSKKRYAGYIRDADGEFRMRFKGLESVRSDWTPLAQNFQRELYRKIFFDQPYEEYISGLVHRLRQGGLDSELVYRKRLRRPVDEYRKNIPPHVQAARKLSRPGDRISYLITLNGPEPVERLESPIDYQHYIDRQLAPVADGILYFLDDSFERIVADQMALF